MNLGEINTKPAECVTLMQGEILFTQFILYER
jgi:hypothetical protein